MAAVLIVVIGALGAGAALAETAEARTNIKVMDRNLYLGTDPILLALSPNKEQFRKDASRLWRQAKRTEFPERSKLIAKEIDARDPDLIGLQEVALWRRSDPGEADDDATKSTNVKFDFLKILQRSLRERGAALQGGGVAERGRSGGPDQQGLRPSPHDARRHPGAARIGAPRHGNPQRQLQPEPGRTDRLRSRGADARVDGGGCQAAGSAVPLREHPPRGVQRRHRRGTGGGALTGVGELSRPTSRPSCLGDLNSDPKGEGDQATAYRAFRQDGFRDAWLKTHPNKPGFTYGFNSELIGSPEDEFDERIDHILFRNGVRVKSMSRFGLDRGNRTAEGRWPSDHAGLVARFSLRER